MTLGSTRTVTRPATGSRARVLIVGAIAALACSACASDRGETVATAPAGVGPAMAAGPGSTRVASSAPLGYPWATGGPSLPTASARAPVIR